MYWLIEQNSQLDEFKSNKFEEAFIEIIPFNNNTHPAQNHISLIYIRPLNSTKGYIISIDHSETMLLNQEDVINVIKDIKKIYVRDKKEFLHYIVLPNLYDITLLQSNYQIVFTKAHEYFYNHHSTKKDINRIIPVVKHYEYCEQIYNDLKHNIHEPINQFYNNRVSVVFNAIERMGVRVQTEQFQTKFHPIEGEYVFTQYNFKTISTRPSNRFGGVNYSALNKDDNTREMFIPRNSKFIELDIKAYHPTLLASLIKHDFDQTDVHQAFANMYQVDYKKAKEITFQQLYGGIFPQYKELEFFKKTQHYTDELWEHFDVAGYVECPISKHRFEKNKLTDMNPSKLLNYVLQRFETVNNVNIIWDMFKILKNKNTKLILYVYDSFLLDFDENESFLLNDIINIFKKYNLNVSIKEGVNYNFK